MTTPIECVKQIEALAQTATPGPWIDDDGYRVLSPKNEIIVSVKHRVSELDDEITDLVLPDYDAKFIAQIRQLAPEAAKHIRDLHAENQTLRERLASSDREFEKQKQYLIEYRDQQAYKSGQLLNEFERLRQHND